ncbi:MAG TPA: hypothetical protein VK907_06665, partial [Phnomibacter sp.]|nr:hypothetical protein [Phnomibacter sp.]
MVRGMLTILIIPMFKFFRSETDYVTGGWMTAIVIMAITVTAAILTKETFHKDLNYVEAEEMMP